MNNIYNVRSKNKKRTHKLDDDADDDAGESIAFGPWPTNVADYWISRCR